MTEALKVGDIDALVGSARSTFSPRATLISQRNNTDDGKARQMVLAPGSPSLFRPRKPPICAIIRTTSFTVGVVAGIFFWPADERHGFRPDRRTRMRPGQDRCSHHNGKTELRLPALSVVEVDPTGAGDCFGGTYIACRSQGFEVDQALRYACAAGARAVMSRGPMEGTATLAELDALIAQTPEPCHD